VAPKGTAVAAVPPTTGSPPVRSVASGVESQVGGPAAWDKNCNSLPISVTITRKPTNGTISVVDGTVQPSQLRVGSDAGHCVGKPIAGKKIMYQSQPGFRGADSVSYAVKSKGGNWSTTVSIDVR
jgi:hypothetical protein